MIEVNTTALLLIYFLLWIAVIVVLWIRELLRIKKHSWSLSNGRLFHCDNCHHSFLVKDGTNLTRCPECNAICINKTRRWL
ncbi:MAG: hypothetical protein IJW31_00485 [Lentisphaeria bacterium]|nr:hypothetical protein [Lentisphaeria bacterium]MBR7128421.1 hypothetical protein [Lentisphaeria bacterium]